MWKYVDDPSTSEIIHKGTDSNIQLSSSELQEWSLRNRFQLNTTKCKELRFDFKRQKQHLNPVMVNNQPVEVIKTKVEVVMLNYWVLLSPAL